jgi:hypothetical protein
MKRDTVEKLIESLLNAVTSVYTDIANIHVEPCEPYSSTGKPSRYILDIKFKTSEDVDKPPIGIISHTLWLESRIEELAKAIIRYSESSESIIINSEQIIEWSEELSELKSRLNFLRSRE